MTRPHKPHQTRKQRRRKRIADLTAGCINKICIPRFYQTDRTWPDFRNPETLEICIYRRVIRAIKEESISEVEFNNLLDQALTNVPDNIRISSSFEELSWSDGRVIHRATEPQPRTTVGDGDCIGRWPLAFDILEKL
jgi:hypothetical protein